MLKTLKMAGVNWFVTSIMFMRYLFIFVAVAMLQACFTKEPFDEYEFEKTTGMEFPVKYAVTETYNNTDGRIRVVIKADTASLVDFLRHYHFDTLKNLQDTIHIIENFIPDNQPDFTKDNPIFYKNGSAKKITWSYIVDLNEQLLWAEIRKDY